MYEAKCPFAAPLVPPLPEEKYCDKWGSNPDPPPPRRWCDVWLWRLAIADAWYGLVRVGWWLWAASNAAAAALFTGSPVKFAIDDKLWLVSALVGLPWRGLDWGCEWCKAPDKPDVRPWWGAPWCGWCRNEGVFCFINVRVALSCCTAKIYNKKIYIFKILNNSRLECITIHKMEAFDFM